MKLIALMLLLLGMNAAHADGDKLSVPEHAKWKEECGSCHLAFSPRLLTADNWQRMMGGLDKHFGANAELDASDNSEILGFLKRNAAVGERHSSETLRISDTSWFKREHHDISAKQWAHAEIKSASNCAACHIGAAKGIWSERDIRVPGAARGGRHEVDDDD